MQDERRPPDPTRRLLKVFGVKVTDYEERTGSLLSQASATPPDRTAELLKLAMEIVELTADLNARLREMNAHVLDTEARALAELKVSLERAQP